MQVCYATIKYKHKLNMQNAILVLIVFHVPAVETKRGHPTQYYVLRLALNVRIRHNSVYLKYHRILP